MDPELVRHIVSVCSLICAAWVIISAFGVTIFCMNSSRLSRIDEPFKDPAQISRERKENGNK